jgi:uncharacterized membrane protein YhaH (DUF805 family)
MENQILVAKSTHRLWSGRIARMHYFLGTVSCGLVGLILRVSQSFDPTFYQRAFVLVVGIPLLFLLYCLTIRRLHDFGYTGWLSLLFLLSLVQNLGNTDWLSLSSLIEYLETIFVLVLLFKSGNPETNKYGLVPSGERKFLNDIFNY